MTAIEITTDPTQNNDGTSREYKYGDKLDFSGGKFKLTYDNGDVIENVPFNKLAEYDVKAAYTGTDTEVEDGALQQLKVTMEIPLLLFRRLTQRQTGEITVKKRPLHVIVNDASYTYGDEPSTYNNRL